MFRANNGAGILIQGETSGYDGPISFLIGFDAQGAITGMKCCPIPKRQDSAETLKRKNLPIALSEKQEMSV